MTVTTVFETAWTVRGLSQLMMDFVADPALANQPLEIPHRYHLTAAKRRFELGVDMIWIGDDVGSQHGMIISPVHWRKFLKPRMADFIAQLKAINPKIKVAYHCDGDIRTIIPELIEMVVDVLNPIQPAAWTRPRSSGCMAIVSVSGARWTNNTRCLLAHQTTSCRKYLAAAAGCRTRRRTHHRPHHNVQIDTPMENFWAMVKPLNTHTTNTTVKNRPRA